jgi:2-polyprenyl-6-methoxyphenol hydroxylase-like FAD-dependent oxidoreductase
MHGRLRIAIVGYGTAGQAAALFYRHRARALSVGAVWCLLPAEDWMLGDVLQQRYGGVREMIGMLPVGRRADREGRWPTFFFSLPGAEVDAFDAAALVRLRDRVGVLWPEISPLLANIESPEQIHRARCRDVLLHRPVLGRLVFIGDAAHAMSPQLGQGVNMALLDASALADAMQEAPTMDAALLVYSHRRRSHLAVYQQLSRWLTHCSSPIAMDWHGGAISASGRWGGCRWPAARC